MKIWVPKPCAMASGNSDGRIIPLGLYAGRKPNGALMVDMVGVPAHWLNPTIIGVRTPQRVREIGGFATFRHVVEPVTHSQNRAAFRSRRFIQVRKIGLQLFLFA